MQLLGRKTFALAAAAWETGAGCTRAGQGQKGKIKGSLGYGTYVRIYIGVRYWASISRAGGTGA